MRKKMSNDEFSKKFDDKLHGRFELLSEYEGYDEKIKVKCLKCRSVFHITPNHLFNRERCPTCSKKKMLVVLQKMREKSVIVTKKKFTKTNEQFRKEFEESSNGEYLLLSDYINRGTKIKVKHKTCGHEYYVTPRNWFHGRRCPKCFGKHKKTTDEFKQLVKDLCGDEYDVIGEYIDKNTKILMKHNTCGKAFETTPDGWLNKGTRCPICKQSHGEKAIEKYLENHGFDYKRQYRIEDCRDDRTLPFDFAVFDDNVLLFLIEYDGEQHFKNTYYSKDGRLEKIQLHDKIKTDYCKSNNIPLLRISYLVGDDNIPEMIGSFYDSLKR